MTLMSPRPRLTRKRLIATAAGQLLRDGRGTAAVETALIAGPLVLLLLGIMEIGRTLWLQSALDHSVEEAARCASVNKTTCVTTSQIQSFAAARSGAGFANATFTATTPACGNQVSASYPMSLNIPFGTYSITLTAQSCYPK